MAKNSPQVRQLRSGSWVIIDSDSHVTKIDETEAHFLIDSGFEDDVETCNLCDGVHGGICPLETAPYDPEFEEAERQAMINEAGWRD